MSGITLNSELLKRLYAEYPGGLRALRDRWFEKYCNTSRDPARLPDRATFYRWRNGELPGSPHQLMRLCGLLDADPLSVLSFPSGEEAPVIQRIYRSFWSNQWGELRTLSFLPEFFGHHTSWPPQAIAAHFYNRTWSLQEFSHDPNIKSNFYPRIEINGDTRVHEKLPQVFHFAYRQPSVFAKRWIQYGYVSRYLNSVMLVNITGDIQRYEAPSVKHPTNVETWFGPGHADFRVASLHTFSLSVQFDGVDNGLKVRFE